MQAFKVTFTGHLSPSWSSNNICKQLAPIPLAVKEKMNYFLFPDLIQIIINNYWILLQENFFLFHAVGSCHIEVDCWPNVVPGRR
jgi:hypothetical protein